MKGQLVEYHNPSHGERYGVTREKRKDGKTLIATSWHALSGDAYSPFLRLSEEGAFIRLTPEEMYSRQKSIQDHFERLWKTSNGATASTKTITFANTLADGTLEGQIGFLPPPMAEELVDYFLSVGWFANAK
jgi:hypothetical protein